MVVAYARISISGAIDTGILSTLVLLLLLLLLLLQQSRGTSSKDIGLRQRCLWFDESVVVRLGDNEICSSVHAPLSPHCVPFGHCRRLGCR